MAHQRHVSFAVVVQVDHKRNRAKVRLMPHGNITGFLRIANAYVGDGWTMHFPIEKDDEVIVEFPSGQLHAGIITWRLHNDQQKWPNRDDFKEELRKCSYKDVFLLHKSGTFMRFFGEKSKNSKDGRGQANDAGDFTLRVRGRGVARIEADNRLELVCPNIRIRTKDGADSTHYFVLSDWVDEWNRFVTTVYNPHTHPPSPPPVPQARFLPKPEVCDMRTQGQVGY